MKKILIVSTVSRQFYLFEQGNIEVLHSLGYEVHAAANFSDVNERLDALEIVRHNFDIQRSPFSLLNVKAYKQLKQIVKTGNYDAIHCHSPMGGVLARLVAKAVGLTPVFYTAHGLHFYKGAPLINWLIYYPIERWLAKYTDVLITINKEDFHRAKKFKSEKVVHIPGIGVDTSKFRNDTIDKHKKLKELDIPDNVFVLLSIGEMTKNKNHETIIKAIAKLDRQDILYLICGRGQLEAQLKELSKNLGVKDNVKFLGFRNDISEICSISDIFVFPSYREGLPVSMIEAMSAGLPVICSSTRGNTDLVQDGQGGFLLNAEDVDGFAQYILKLVNDAELRKTMGIRNIEIAKNYDKVIVKKEMRELYESYL